MTHTCTVFHDKVILKYELSDFSSRHVLLCMIYVHSNIYTYKEERERERESVCVCVCVTQISSRFLAVHLPPPPSSCTTASLPYTFSVRCATGTRVRGLLNPTSTTIVRAAPDQPLVVLMILRCTYRLYCSP